MNRLSVLGATRQATLLLSSAAAESDEASRTTGNAAGTVRVREMIETKMPTKLVKVLNRATEQPVDGTAPIIQGADWLSMSELTVRRRILPDDKLHSCDVVEGHFASTNSRNTAPFPRFTRWC